MRRNGDIMKILYKKHHRHLLGIFLPKRKILSVLMAAIFLAGSLSASASAAKTEWPTGPQKGSLSSASAIVMELSTGSVLYSKNIHDRHYPASITKILTALLTLENCSLSETVTFTEAEAHGIEIGSSSLYCEPGEKFTVEQLVYGIMLQSANEMCLAAADHVAGSTEKFVDMMNERVAELGLKDTHFMNPNGLHNDNHYTSAYDMACIAREAWKNTTFQKVTGTKTYSIGATNKRKANEIMQLLNHHQMVNGYNWPQYEYQYCVGGKTGFTSMALSTLVTYAEKDGMQLVAVIMKAKDPKQGEPNEYTDTTRILNYAFENYTKYTLDEKSSQVNESLFNTFDSYFNAEESPLRLAGESSVVLPKGVDLSKAKQKITYDKNVTLTNGENTIGKVTYTYGGRTVGSSDIIYDTTETAGHLDEASREVVDSEIQQIKTNNKNHAFLFQKLSGLKYGWLNLVSFFQDRLILLVVILLIILLMILLFINYRMHSRTRRRRKRRSSRNSGGGMSLNNRKVPSFNKRRGRKRHGVDYTSSRKPTKRARETSSNMSARRLKKNRKKTKESFGKSFYDF